MNAEIKTHRNGDVTVVDVDPSIVRAEHSGELQKMMRDLGKAGIQRVLLNVAGVSCLERGALEEFVTAYIALAGTGGQMKLVNVGSGLREALWIAGLDTILEPYADGTEPLLVDASMLWLGEFIELYEGDGT